MDEKQMNTNAFVSLNKDIRKLAEGMARAGVENRAQMPIIEYLTNTVPDFNVDEYCLRATPDAILILSYIAYLREKGDKVKADHVHRKVLGFAGMPTANELLGAVATTIREATLQAYAIEAAEQLKEDEFASPEDILSKFLKGDKK